MSADLEGPTAAELRLGRPWRAGAGDETLIREYRWQVGRGDLSWLADIETACVGRTRHVR